MVAANLAMPLKQCLWFGLSVDTRIELSAVFDDVKVENPYQKQLLSKKICSKQLIKHLFCNVVAILNTAKTILYKIISIVLICILAFSITPAVTFHNLFSAHEDHDIVHKHTHSSEVATAGINCHFDSFVGNTNFIRFFTPSTTAPEIIVSDFLNVTIENFYSRHHFYAELRGPPIVA